MNKIKDLFISVTSFWIFFEILNIIDRIWFKNAKNNMPKGIIKQIFPSTRYHRSSIYAKVLVETENGTITAHCHGWFPRIGEKVILKINPLLPISIKHTDKYYSCFSEERYLKDSMLKLFLIPSRCIMAFLWSGFFLWRLNPNLFRNIFLNSSRVLINFSWIAFSLLWLVIILIKRNKKK